MKKPKQIKKDKTILLIDSNKIHCLLVEKIFKPTSYKIIFAHNKKEVYNYFRLNTHFDLIIIEVLLSHADGYTLMKLIKEIRTEIPIIALTVCDLPHEKERCFKYGCDAYLSKPFVSKNLIQIVEQVLKENELKKRESFSSF